MHLKQRSFTKPNPRFNLAYLQPNEYHLLQLKGLYFTNKAESLYFLAFIIRISGYLHFATHSIYWDSDTIKSPVLRFLFGEQFTYSVHKFSEFPLASSFPKYASRTTLLVQCSSYELFPRSPYSAKETTSVIFFHINRMSLNTSLYLMKQTKRYCSDHLIC